MTLLAGHGCVQAKQRKPGQAVVKNDVPAPGHFIVAVLAGSSLLPLVYVFDTMAGKAGDIRFSIPDIALVAQDTGSIPVRAAKREVCTCVVVKPEFFPGGRRMAGAAITAIAPVMHIVMAMTGVAV